jgi:hypothetical protein
MEDSAPVLNDPIDDALRDSKVFYERAYSSWIRSYIPSLKKLLDLLS